MNNYIETTSRKSRDIQVNPRLAKRNSELLAELCSRYKLTEANGFAALVNFSSTSEAPVHRWFRYREGYSIQLVRALIKDLPKGSIILDPFCGSGTTLLAAQDLGFPSIGFEINPLSAFVSRVKTNSLTDEQIYLLNQLLSKANKLTSASKVDPKPLLSIIDKVFHPQILHALLVLRCFIKSVENQQLRDFLMVAWLSILEDVSNVFK